MTKGLNITQDIPKYGDNITPKKKDEKVVKEKKEKLTSIKLHKNTVERINKLLWIEQAIRQEKQTQDSIINILLDEYDIKEMNKDARV